MSGFYKKFSIVGTAIIILLFLFYLLGIRVNTTKSIPIGIYLTSNENIEIGSFVLFCPPDNDIFLAAKKRNYITSGFCEGDYGYMMKQVVGQCGDNINITNEGLFVNGQIIPHSKLIEKDLDGNSLPVYSKSYFLKENEVLLMSNVSDTSFDGRYFGPINKKQILTVVNPLITFGGE